MYNLQLEIVLCQILKFTFCSSTNRFHRNYSTASLRWTNAGYISQNENCHNILAISTVAHPSLSLCHLGRHILQYLNYRILLLDLK